MEEEAVDKLEKALAWLDRDRLYYVNLLEVLRRGSGELLAAEDRGVVVYDRSSGSYMFALEEGGEDLLELIPRDAELVTGHAMWALPILEERWGTCERMEVRSAAWLRPEPPAPPVFPGELRMLDESWAPWAAAHYSNNFGGVAYMEGVARRGLLGAFVDGRPAGFVGFHDEGSIGMLEVLPEYRRRGLGAALELAAIRVALSRGQYAFGQVEAGNAASLTLQRSLGLEVSERSLFWLFR